MPVTNGQLVDGTTAVVLGASLAGMLAAAALARHLDRVIIIERDHLPDGPEWRRGSPQSRHAHNLMMAGHQAMDRLLPGLQEELVERRSGQLGRFSQRPIHFGRHACADPLRSGCGSHHARV